MAERFNNLSYSAPDPDRASARQHRLTVLELEMLEALYVILNVQAAAKLGTQGTALEGLDVDYHFDEVRKAIRKADPEGKHIT